MTSAGTMRAGSAAGPSGTKRSVSRARACRSRRLSGSLVWPEIPCASWCAAVSPRHGGPGGVR
jgi:hypothetical protein